MSVPAILLPLFVQIALTMFLGIWMGRERMTAVKAGQIDKDAMLYPARWPERVQKVANSFHNQLEMPFLFYVLVILALVTHKADLLFVVLSWVFVVTRIAHASIHTTSNILTWRGASFGAGVVILMTMWVIFAFRILFL